ncbi:hypothetical protein KKG52_01660 [Patescibacteria group bacterium]|nr:hypothetical protein [Patescibacteria group bacterium]
MTATGHAVIGAIIAAKVGNPTLAIPLAVASHVIADTIPHWDVGTNRGKKSRKSLIYNAMFDVLLGFFIAFLILGIFFPGTDPFYAIAIILIAQSLDWITAPYYFFRITNPPFFLWTYKFQKLFDQKLDRPWGIITQVIAVIALLVIAVKT